MIQKEILEAFIKVVSGWKRLTFGSTHVLDTDWLEMRTLTGT